LHGRVIFAGDAAHQVSPFGARGAIPVLKTPENWRGSSTACCGGFAEGLLETITASASAAADENIRESTRSDRFHGP